MCTILRKDRYFRVGRLLGIHGRFIQKINESDPTKDHVAFYQDVTLVSLSWLDQRRSTAGYPGSAGSFIGSLLLT